MFEILKNAEVVDVNVIPTSYRALYTQSGDKYVLSDTVKDVASAIDGLNRTNGAIRREVDELKAKKPDLTPWLALGSKLNVEGEVNADAVSAAIDAVIAKGSKGYEVDMAKVKTSLEKTYTNNLAAKDGELNTMNKAMSRHMVEGAAKAAIAKHKGSVELLLPHVNNAVKVVKDGDDYVVRVLDAQGAAVPDGKGGFLDVDGYVASMRSHPSFARAFDSDAPSGGGKQPASSSKQVLTKPSTVVDTRSANDKIRAGLESYGKK
jgi:hypothetical protein